MILATATGVERFRELITQHLGLSLDGGELDNLEALMRRRAERRGESCETYLARLQTGSPAELGELARELTTPETYFFRNMPQFRAFAETVLPEWRARRAGRAPLRVLSAGCASGEEPYTIAMIAADVGLESGKDILIRAVDANPAVVERAQAANFSAWALRETPAELRQRWFRQEGRTLRLPQSLSASIRFEVKNITDRDEDLWAPRAYDVVFCRNVMMYFTRPHATELLGRIARSLVESGYLFLGHAETIRGLSQEFHLRHTHGTFYYQRKPATPSRPAPMPAPEPPVSPGPVEDDWVEQIRGASDRVSALTGRAASSMPDLSAERQRAVAATVEMLRRERFAEALTLLRGLDRAVAATPELMLLEAVILVHRGELANAEQVCRALLVLDDCSAMAQFVLALCKEAAGDLRAAADHDQVASYLDPAFAMPRLHQGRLSKAAGDREAARRELAQALVLLEREDPLKLLLFGGGFDREGLLAICRAELAACGGRP